MQRLSSSIGLLACITLALFMCSACGGGSSSSSSRSSSSSSGTSTRIPLHVQGNWVQVDRIGSGKQALRRIGFLTIGPDIIVIGLDGVEVIVGEPTGHGIDSRTGSGRVQLADGYELTIHRARILAEIFPPGSEPVQTYSIDVTLAQSRAGRMQQLLHTRLWQEQIVADAEVAWLKAPTPASTPPRVVSQPPTSVVQAPVTPARPRHAAKHQRLLDSVSRDAVTCLSGAEQLIGLAEGGKSRKDIEIAYARYTKRVRYSILQKQLQARLSGDGQSALSAANTEFAHLSRFAGAVATWLDTL